MATPRGGNADQQPAAETTKNNVINCGVPLESTDSSSSDDSLEMEDDALFDGKMNADEASSIKVTGGRPSIEAIIEDIVKAERPGVYSCGPRSLIEAVEGSIRIKRDDCAFYQEDSEM